MCVFVCVFVYTVYGVLQRIDDALPFRRYFPEAVVSARTELPSARRTNECVLYI